MARRLGIIFLITALGVSYVTSLCFATETTFDDVMGYFSRTVPLRTPEAKPKIPSLEKSHAQENKPSEEREDTEEGKKENSVYLSPATNIYLLWKRLGIQEDLMGQKPVLFKCNPNRRECFLATSRVDVTAQGLVKIIRLADPSLSDIQYLFFKDTGYGVNFSGHLEYTGQGQWKPKIHFWEGNLFSITSSDIHSPAATAHVTRFFKIDEGKIKEAIRYYSFFESGKERSESFDVVISAETDYSFSSELLTLLYKIQVKMNERSYVSAVEGVLPETPVVQAEKKIVLRRAADGFILDKELSNASLGQIAMLCNGGRDDYYAIFMKEFDSIGTQDPKTREWFEQFKRGIVAKR